MNSVKWNLKLQNDPLADDDNDTEQIVKHKEQVNNDISDSDEHVNIEHNKEIETTDANSTEELEYEDENDDENKEQKPPIADNDTDELDLRFGHKDQQNTTSMDGHGVTKVSKNKEMISPCLNFQTFNTSIVESAPVKNALK